MGNGGQGGELREKIPVASISKQNKVDETDKDLDNEADDQVVKSGPVSKLKVKTPMSKQLAPCTTSCVIIDNMNQNTEIRKKPIDSDVMPNSGHELIGPALGSRKSALCLYCHKHNVRTEFGSHRIKATWRCQKCNVHLCKPQTRPCFRNYHLELKNNW